MSLESIPAGAGGDLAASERHEKGTRQMQGLGVIGSGGLFGPG
ncbi:MAG: hypothetical protein ACLTSZ_08670 [Lachnospiraceae bacterium]